ncbi:MAG: SLC13 family permease [Acutalibacteraceae bacterium]
MDIAKQLSSVSVTLVNDDKYNHRDEKPFNRFLHKVAAFCKKNVVLLVATVVAAISCIFVPPDAAYADYFDWKTLVSLFCMLAVIAALRNIMFFRILARNIIKVFKTTRASITALVFITYVASMLIANDMALITFLPLGIFVLAAEDKHKYMPFTFVMQTIAANLGGMITPFGNPQNLYLYNTFNIPTGEFFKIMAIPTAISLVLIALCCVFVKKEPLVCEEQQIAKLNVKRAVVYFAMFAYAIAIVFRAVPYWTGLLVIPVLLVMDRKALKDVDYALLLTFMMFFVFSGNLSRIPAVSEFFGGLLEKNTLLTGAFCCQFISNVPSAILLSGFTDTYAPLLVAVNIGGCGTLISSLASLITFKQFCAIEPKKAGKYLVVYHAMSFGFLAVLILSCVFIY